jgi:hypothetical protein
MRTTERIFMLRRFVKEKPSILDEPIEKVLTEMNMMGPDSEEYHKMIDHLERLTRLKEQERRFRVTPDTMAIVAGNLLGILIIVAYEQKHVVVSKGLGFVLKSRN